MKRPAPRTPALAPASDEPQPLKCPDCDGMGEVRGLVKFSDGRPCAFQTLPCFTCKGSKEISGEHAGWRKRGRELRMRRVNGAPYRSVIQEAQALGVKTLDLADAEHGRRNPDPYLAMPRPDEPQARRQP